MRELTIKHGQCGTRSMEIIGETKSMFLVRRYYPTSKKWKESRISKLLSYILTVDGKPYKVPDEIRWGNKRRGIAKDTIHGRFGHGYGCAITIRGDVCEWSVSDWAGNGDNDYLATGSAASVADAKAACLAAIRKDRDAKPLKPKEFLELMFGT